MQITKKGICLRNNWIYLQVLKDILSFIFTGSGETSSSFSWCPTDAKTFLVGMANKHLRLYDLRGRIFVFSS